MRNWRAGSKLNDGFDRLEACFLSFLEQSGSELTSECYIPSVVDELIHSGQANCPVLPTDSEWFGVTYPEDKPHVVESIAKLIREDEYPSPLV